MVSTHAIRNSFDRVRNDIRQLSAQIEVMKEQLSRHEQMLQSMANNTLCKPDRYVAAEDGSKFHVESCPFAKRIKPANRMFYATADQAMDDGHKACECVKHL